MRALAMSRVADLCAARRQLTCLAALMALVPGLLVVLGGGSVQELIVLVLPLIPLLVLLLITAGALSAAARDVPCWHEASAEFPRPLELRG